MMSATIYQQTPEQWTIQQWAEILSVYVECWSRAPEERDSLLKTNTFPSVSSQFAEYKHRNLHSLVRYIYVYWNSDYY